MSCRGFHSLVQFYTATRESILTSSITTWYSAATAEDKCRLQRVVHRAEEVIGCNLPSPRDLHASRTVRRPGGVLEDPSSSPLAGIHVPQVVLHTVCALAVQRESFNPSPFTL